MFGKRALLFLLSVSVLTLGCSHTGSFSKRSSYPHGMQKKLLGSHDRFDIPMVANDRVMAWVDFFQGANHARFERYLERSGRYVPWMRKILREEGLPQDLVFLALIESGFSNNAYSRARASGPWQFIRSTGVHYGLDNNGWMDERRDPEKATRAAAAYLKKLYGDFGDWYLAMAAYNAGEGRVANAIQASGSRNFWEISASGTSYLKAETKDYVPKFLAAALIAKMPSRFGFKDVSYHEPFASEEIRVDGPLDFIVAAELAGVSIEEIQQLNPELSRFMTPPHSYNLRIPTGTKERFEIAYAQLPPERRIMMASHKVKKGESLQQIARRYGVDSKAIVAANDLKRKKLKSGMVLIIPKGRAAKVYASNSGETHYYKVRRHDRLDKVAAKFGVSVTEVKKENHLKGNQLRVGQRLKITTLFPEKGGDLLAYNKNPRRVHTNGVEWLIKQEQQKGDKESDFDQDNVKVKPEPVVVDPIPESNKESLASPASEIEESDLTEATHPAPKKNVTPKKVASKKVHVIKNGDNLWTLAKRYRVKIADLKQWNNLGDGKMLRPGKTLIVYLSQPVSKREKTKVKTKAKARPVKVAPETLTTAPVEAEPAMEAPAGINTPDSGQSLTGQQGY